MEDKETGISIRFIRQFDLAAGQSWSRVDMMDTTSLAFMLAAHDTRDEPFSVRLRDALEYLTTLPDTDPLNT